MCVALNLCRYQYNGTQIHACITCINCVCNFAQLTSKNINAMH